MKKIVIIASTSGSVLSKVLELEQIRSSIYMVISDQDCGAIEVAKKLNIQNHIIPCSSGKEFSSNLVSFFKNEDIDIFISFYTRIFSSIFLNKYPNKVFNFHPSLLPACKGKDGFGQTVRSGSKFMGSTLHIVDEGIDTGKPVIQSIHPIMPSLTFDENRHIIFIQQCKIFIQFILWLNQNRVINGDIKDGSYRLEEFIPNLESSLALNFNVKLNL